MKTFLPILVMLALINTACKKDRQCNCTQTLTVTATQVVTGTRVQVSKYTSTLKKVSPKTARNACLHTVKSYTNSAGSTFVTDLDCELK